MTEVTRAAKGAVLWIRIVLLRLARRATLRSAARARDSAAASLAASDAFEARLRALVAARQALRSSRR